MTGLDGAWTMAAARGAADGPWLVEGYASLFGVADLAGDVVRAGAFAATLRRGMPAMLLQHGRGKVAGRWLTAREDGRGLFLRGLVEAAAPAGRAALRALAEGLNGLSIGFHAVDWRPRASGGRDLLRVDLAEVSLVSAPLLPGARLERVAQGAMRAAA